MTTTILAKPLLFGTLPPSNEVEGDYLGAVADVSRWCEDGGCTGVLVYTDNSLLDPWLVSREVMRHTSTLCPLVAVQPVYMHPYGVAKLVATLADLYQRRVYLNMVAGGFLNDLRSLGDETEHDRRYERVVEYTSIVQQLVADEGPVSLEGEWYQVRNLRLKPGVAKHLRPGYMVSGSSPAGMSAARRLGATAVQYPKPVSGYDESSPGETIDAKGIRIGIIAREDADEAWRIAWDRFPEEPRGRLLHRLAMATTDSFWHRQLSRLGGSAPQERPPYWLHPFENYKTFCPYLVGAYDDVAQTLARYLALGFTTFILDVPSEADDLVHTQIVFERASSRVAMA